MINATFTVCIGSFSTQNLNLLYACYGKCDSWLFQAFVGKSCKISEIYRWLGLRLCVSYVQVSVESINMFMCIPTYTEVNLIENLQVKDMLHLL